MHPGVGQQRAAGALDGGAQRDGPAVLEQHHGRGAPRRDRLLDVPEVVLVEDLVALGARLGPCLGADLGALEAACAEADQRPDVRAELGGLALGEIAVLHRLDGAVLVLSDHQRVHEPDGVALPEPLELGQDLAAEVGLVEAQHQELHGSDGHWHSSSLAVQASSVALAASSSVSLVGALPRTLSAGGLRRLTPPG